MLPRHSIYAFVNQLDEKSRVDCEVAPLGAVSGGGFSGDRFHIIATQFGRSFSSCFSLGDFHESFLDEL
jgi:hypothetical protein